MTLGDVARIERVTGPRRIDRHDQQRATYVQVLGGRSTDLGRLIDRAAVMLRGSTAGLVVERLR